MTVRAILPRVLLALAIAVAAIWLAFNLDQLEPALIKSSIRDLGLWAPLAHVVLFAIGSILFVPGAVFDLAGSALFGPLWWNAAPPRRRDVGRHRFLPYCLFILARPTAMRGW